MVSTSHDKTTRSQASAYRRVLERYENDSATESRVIEEIVSRSGPGSLLDDLDRIQLTDTHTLEDDVSARGHMRLRARHKRNKISS